MIGFYGGTFSPPHKGHVHAAEVFSKAVSISKLLIIPTAIPPHKAMIDGADGEARLDMCRLAFSHIEGAEISDMELARGGKSYTADTIAQLKAKYGAVAMLIGTDMFLTLDEWYHPEYIFDNADIYCIRREADFSTEVRIDKKNCEYQEKYGHSVKMISTDALEVSSTEIRSAISRGEVSRFLPENVAAYIRERGLYQ